MSRSHAYHQNHGILVLSYDIKKRYQPDTSSLYQSGYVVVFKSHDQTEGHEPACLSSIAYQLVDNAANQQ